MIDLMFPLDHIDLAFPAGREKARFGSQPHWRTVFVYECKECNKEVRVFAHAFRGKTPVPGVGAIACPHCDK